MTSPEPLLCGHRSAPRERRRRLVCDDCGSYRDLDAVDGYLYDDEYPESHRHFQDAVGALKAGILDAWLRRCGVDPRGLAVCETGFGGGQTLRRLLERGAFPLGVEAVYANLRHAEAIGLPRTSLFKATARPARLPRPVDLWLFLDSFEHLPDPAGYLEWMRDCSSPRAAVLVVAPRADSLSNLLLGPLWPHRLPDHAFHWSRDGLAQLFSRYDFALRRSFFPWKRVTPGMVAAHLRHQRGWKGRTIDGLVSLLEYCRISVPFNLGEMGLFFERRGP